MSTARVPGASRARLSRKVLPVISMLAESEMMIPAWPPSRSACWGSSRCSRKMFPCRSARSPGVVSPETSHVKPARPLWMNRLHGCRSHRDQWSHQIASQRVVVEVGVGHRQLTRAEHLDARRGLEVRSASESGCQPLPSHSKFFSTRSWVAPLKQVVALPKQRTSAAWIDHVREHHRPTRSLVAVRCHRRVRSAHREMLERHHTARVGVVVVEQRSAHSALR